MNDIWNDPDFVVRAGRVLEAVIPSLIKLHALFPQKFGIAHVTDDCTNSPANCLNLSDYFRDQIHVSINIEVVEDWHLKWGHHSPNHEHLGLLKIRFILFIFSRIVSFLKLPLMP